MWTVLRYMRGLCISYHILSPHPLSPLCPRHLPHSLIPLGALGLCCVRHSGYVYLSFQNEDFVRLHTTNIQLSSALLDVWVAASHLSIRGVTWLRPREPRGIVTEPKCAFTAHELTHLRLTCSFETINYIAYTGTPYRQPRGSREGDPDGSPNHHLKATTKRTRPNSSEVRQLPPPVASHPLAQVSPEMGNTYSDVIALHDVAVYGSLCALASLDRSELRTRVISNISFREVLELAPEVCVCVGGGEMTLLEVSVAPRFLLGGSHLHMFAR